MFRYLVSVPPQPPPVILSVPPVNPVRSPTPQPRPNPPSLSPPVTRSVSRHPSPSSPASNVVNVPVSSPVSNPAPSPRSSTVNSPRPDPVPASSVPVHSPSVNHPSLQPKVQLERLPASHPVFQPRVYLDRLPPSEIPTSSPTTRSPVNSVRPASPVVTRSGRTVIPRSILTYDSKFNQCSTLVSSPLYSHRLFLPTPETLGIVCADASTFCFVSHLVPDTLAHRLTLVPLGSHIVSVNGIPVSNSRSFYSLLHSEGPLIDLTYRPPPPVPPRRLRTCTFPSCK